MHFSLTLKYNFKNKRIAKICNNSSAFLGKIYYSLISFNFTLLLFRIVCFAVKQVQYNLIFVSQIANLHYLDSAIFIIRSIFLFKKILLELRICITEYTIFLVEFDIFNLFVLFALS